MIFLPIIIKDFKCSLDYEPGEESTDEEIDLNEEDFDG